MEKRDQDKTQVHRVRPITLVSEEARSAALVCIAGRSVGQVYVLEDQEAELMIGRAPECAISLDDSGISRQHGKIIKQDGKFILIDLESTNGTYYDGEAIDVLGLEDGQKIQVGTSTILQFRYQDQKELQFHSLVQNFKNHDPMTQTYNKRAFSDELEKEVGFSHRHGQPLTLAMIDLDHFKQVNDTYGHPAGDEVLKTVAECIKQAIRKEDVLARYGGEEFALLLRKTRVEEAFLLAERVRRAIEGLEITHDGRRIPVTASIGLCMLEPEETPADLLESADRRLYEAKKKGRNRVESALFDG